MQFKNHVLFEEAKAIETYLRDPVTPSLVVDLGTIGWFHVYTIQVYNEAMMQRLNAYEGEQKQLAAGFLHSLRRPFTPESLKSKDMYKYYHLIADDPVLDKLNDVREVFSEATKRLYKLGFHRRRQVIFIANMESKVNHLTGGSVGGFADIMGHAIGINKTIAMRDKKFFVDAIIHEWTHMYHFKAMSKEQKGQFAEWFNRNIRGKAEYVVPDNITNTMCFAFHKAFSAISGFSMGSASGNYKDTPEVEKVLRQREAFDKNLGQHRTATLKKQFKTSFGVKIPRKTVVSAKTSMGMDFKTPKVFLYDAEGKERLGVIEGIDNVVKYLNFEDIDHESHDKIYHSEDKDKAIKDHVNVNAYKMVEEMESEMPNSVKHHFFSVFGDNGEEQLKDVIASMVHGIENAPAFKDGELYAPLKNVIKNHKFKMSAKHNLIALPDGNMLRAALFKKGLTPSEYGGSNDAELFAEAMVYMTRHGEELAKKKPEFINAVRRIIMGAR